MATIKLQPSGKVVIKGGKVACGCCGGCCMYPAKELGEGLYTINDLPNEVSFFFAAGELIATAYKLPSPLGDVSLGIAYYSYTYAGSTEYVWLENIEPDPSIPDLWVWYSYVAYPIGGCLITQPNYSFDQFADTYTISGPISGVVTRIVEYNPSTGTWDICSWVGTGLKLTNFGYQWKVNKNNKSGFQNTPVGSYAGGFTVS